ncbi:Sugar transport protein [Quillaja saponaria]|uniref:Sugar transport protein n=1 Tax=Quillaja saponaria TaxID=32244 RepID=A0AAD7LWP2_QUISA|nr:Sugar transport protein [Quillaja saponaria]
MAVGGFAVDGHVGGVNGKITASVMITCFVAASSGLIFGYDIGISGGVTTMVPFLHKFFPSVLRKIGEAKTNFYCLYDSEVLTLFTSSLYIAGLASSLVASRLTAIIGRRNIMLMGGCSFLAGAAINGGAANIAMLILGRMLLGFGVGFTNQATPVYLSEVAPARWRGAFNSGFQFCIGFGVVAANSINFGTAKHSWGWRLSLGLAIVPATIMTIGALFIYDSPTSLVERGKISEAKQSLKKVRGSGADVEAELADLIKWNEVAKTAKQESFVTIFQRQYRPHLVMSILIPFFQNFTGINIIAFYAPVLFQSVGFGSDNALIGAIILGVVSLGGILVSAAVVDRYGRRILFILGGVQMFICLVGVTIVLATTTETVVVLVLMCVYAAGFAWSWGPLCWLIPSEICPIKIRSTGQSISIAVNFATTFVLSQTFLTMLCHFKYGTFLFYAGWVGIMTIFVMLFLPETKGIPLDSMYKVWEQHWYWQRFVQGQSSQG